MTAEVMPHHLTMTDEWVAGCRQLVNVDEPAGRVAMLADPDTKVNPALADARRLPPAAEGAEAGDASTSWPPTMRHTLGRKNRGVHSRAPPSGSLAVSWRCR